MLNPFKSTLICSLFLLIALPIFGQKIDPNRIDIVRDKWGVPHIYAPTDAGVAYGLAWAHAEDDFKTIQQGFLASKAMLGSYLGKSGATIDFVLQLLQCRKIVEQRYDTDLSADFKLLLEGYAAGINAYAQAHPKELLMKKLFPANPKDMMTYLILQMALSSGVDGALEKIVSSKIPLAFKKGGSNAYAINSKKSADGLTYLAINSHQPLEGPVAWYEAHLNSEEGWNILGALFPGAPLILHGCNEYLGWAHTVNNPDQVDVFQLEMNPANNNEYKFDGKWETLEEESIKLKVKILGLQIGLKKKGYQSLYGPTLKNKQGVFSIRMGALFEIRSLEEWYRMNKAQNFTQFKKALDMVAISGYNIMYADRYDTIYYLSNGKIPLRDPAYAWNTTLPGNTSKTLWKAFHPLEDLPQVLNPSSGYLFNSNHSPFNATAKKDNIAVANYDPTMHYETNENNRSLRFMQLIQEKPKITYEDFKRIKYDYQLPDSLAYRIKTDTLFLLLATKYPDVAEQIDLLKKWDRNADANSEGAALFGVAYYKIAQEINKTLQGSLTEAQSVDLLRYAKAYLQKHFGKTKVTLGEYQLLVRGDKTLPLFGLPDVISAMYSAPYKDGRVKGFQGESYIELVKFTPQGPIIETINCYGTSNRLSQPHYADQMELYLQQKTKPMTLNKAEVYRQAKSVYHPGR